MRLLGRLALLALILAAALAVVAWIWVHERPEGNPDEVRVVIARGATGAAIVDQLEARGLAAHPLALYWTLELGGAFEVVQAGVYVIPGDANALEIEAILSQPSAAAPHLTVTFIPGESVWESARRMQAAGVGLAGDLVRLAADREAVEGLGVRLPLGPARAPRTDGVAHTWLEGFLYPETHFFDPGATARDVAVRAVRHFDQVWGDLTTRYRADLLAVRERWGLSDHELIVLASLVEEEVQAPEEAPRVAGVFYNRLAAGMRLETDPTLMYHPDRVAGEPRPTHRRDRRNPYNTYAIAGLPPGPICSPGRRALEAVLRPERHDFVYFVAKRQGRGRHAFAKTLAEHRDNIERYLR